MTTKDRMLCLLCHTAEVYPEEPAGLCVSCRASVAAGEWYPYPEGGKLYLVFARAAANNPLGYEGHGELPRHEYTPPPGLHDEYAADLVSLRWGRPKPPHAHARDVIEAIRAAGVKVYVDTGDGRAVLSRTRGLPYDLLVRFVELQLWIEDELTKEKGRDIQACELRNVQVEQTGVTRGVTDRGTDANQAQAEGLHASGDGREDLPALQKVAD